MTDFIWKIAVLAFWVILLGGAFGLVLAVILIALDIVLLDKVVLFFRGL